mmetsp:Transcript_1941/g.3505  ORF Transcript_1941/g.3505 Transcript_1941/m.3505 type:complete len:96 (+) Transcript_1941:70-357(+)
MKIGRVEYGLMILGAGVVCLLDAGRRGGGLVGSLECFTAVVLAVVGGWINAGALKKVAVGRGDAVEWAWEQAMYRPDFAVLNHRGSAICGRHVLE